MVCKWVYTDSKETKGKQYALLLSRFVCSFLCAHDLHGGECMSLLLSLTSLDKIAREYINDWEKTKLGLDLELSSTDVALFLEDFLLYVEVQGEE